MKTRSVIAKYFALFAVVFALSTAFVLGFAGRAAADCQVVLFCFDYFDECPAGSDCPGDPCNAFYDHKSLANGRCCGAVVEWQCDL